MKKSKTKLIIVIVVIFVTAIIAVGGAYLYFATDLLKGNQELFFKYISQNGDVIEKITKNLIEENVLSGKYTTESDITFDIESNVAEIANQTIPAGNFSIKYLAKTDTVEKQKSSETTIKYQETDLFTLKYIRDNDIYALKSDEVINKYLAFDNNNLKEFAEKFGVSDTTMIPNKIELDNIQNALLLTKEEQKAIISKYLPVIISQISNDKYSKEKNVTININNNIVNTNAYSLELTKADIVNISINVLDKLKKDDETLNIIVGKIRLLDSNSIITIIDLKNAIQNEIDDLKNQIAVSSTITKITVYECDKELIRTEIINGYDIICIDVEATDTTSNLSISFGKQYPLIQPEVSVVGLDVKLKKIELQQSQNSMTAVVIFDLEDETIKLSMQRKTVNGVRKENTSTIRLNITDTTYITANINTIQTPVNDIEIENLTTQNSVTINKFSAQYLMNLSQQIGNKLQSLYTKKLGIIPEIYNGTI